MKRLLFLLMLVPLLSVAQKKKTPGIGYLAGTFFSNDALDNKGGLGVGVGVSPQKNVSFGAAFNFFVFDPDFRYLTGYFDFRVLIPGLDKPITPFIAIQPGKAFYNNTRNIAGVEVGSKGGFLINLMTGIISKPKKGIGPYLEIGYSNITFLNNNVKTQYGGLKIQGGLSF